MPVLLKSHFSVGGLHSAHPRPPSPPVHICSKCITEILQTLGARWRCRGWECEHRNIFLPPWICFWNRYCLLWHFSSLSTCMSIWVPISLFFFLSVMQTFLLSISIFISFLLLSIFLPISLSIYQFIYHWLVSFFVPLSLSMYLPSILLPRMLHFASLFGYLSI